MPPSTGVAEFTGIGGSFGMEWVADLLWNQWQNWTGIHNKDHFSSQVMLNLFSNVAIQSVHDVAIYGDFCL
jgi:hypothetical protein